MTKWTAQDLKRAMEKINENNITIPPSDMEQDTCNALLGEEKIKRPTPFVCIHVHSIRRRLADVDGISAKAVIDGIVKAGLLPNDTTKVIKEVTFSQEKGKDEKTIIDIVEEK